MDFAVILELAFFFELHRVRRSVRLDLTSVERFASVVRCRGLL
jgi:hypothetical protein